LFWSRVELAKCGTGLQHWDQQSEINGLLSSLPSSHDSLEESRNCLLFTQINFIKPLCAHREILIGAGGDKTQIDQEENFFATINK